MDPAGRGGERRVEREKKTTLALQIFDKLCKGFRVESLPVEICKDMFQNSTYQAKIMLRLLQPLSVYLYFSLFIRYHMYFFMFFFPPLAKWFTTDFSMS